MSDDNFGAAGGMVFGADGQPVRFYAMTTKVCETCRDATGGIKMGVLRDTGGSATLACPNCGETINLFSSEVPYVKKPGER